jgi:hypothetical protein
VNPSRHLPVAFVVFVAVLAFVLGSSRACADSIDDWVAECGGNKLTLRGLATVAVDRVRQELLEPSSGPLTILRQLIEERAVVLEAAKLGVGVTEADVDQRWRELDAEVRGKTNGSRTLQEVVAKDLRSTVPEFRANLRNLLRKERVASHEKYLGKSLPTQSQQRLAQVEVVIAELLKRAKVVYGVPTALQAQPGAVPPGAVATVNDSPISREQYGLELVRRLPEDEVRRMIDQECKAVVTAGMALSETDMQAAIEQERENWNKWREMSSQESFKNVSYDDYVKARHRVSLEDLKHDRFFRGWFGLHHSFRHKVTPEEVRKEWEAKKGTLYGDSIRVTDVSIGFAQKNQLVNVPNARERKDALRMAHEIRVQRESGTPFDEIARGVNAKQDRSFTAVPRRLRNTDDDRILWDRALAMKDDEVATVETLSAVHVLRREERVAAPSFEEVKAMIAEGITKQRADTWLDAQMKDPKVCRVRWPLPDEVWLAVLPPAPK